MAAPHNAKPAAYTTLVLLLLLRHVAAAGLGHPDAEALFQFKTAVDPDGGVLTSWNPYFEPCNAAKPWLGVSCLRNRVAYLVLENLNLRGALPISLASLRELRVISLKNNGFSGRIPDLSPLTNLKLFFISHNQFSGDFPASLTSLTKMYRLDLSYNNFSGNIPMSVNALLHLLTFRLEGNQFTGSISFLSLPNLQDFNVSGNGFTGEIPASLSGFPVSTFWNNPNLCGPPLAAQCAVLSSSPTNPGRAMASPLNLTSTVTSSPITMPGVIGGPAKPLDIHRGKISSLALIFIIIGDVIILGMVSTLLYWYFWSNYSSKVISGKNGSSHVEKIVYSSNPYSYPTQSASDQRGKIVFFDGERRFELEDLLRASAEMLGKGGFGTTYKAMLEGGVVVAVKRLKDLNGISKKEFEQQMEILGRLRHPNLITLKAYYFAGDEKLLVLDHMACGSLFWLLHGNRGPGRTPLDWTSRFKIAAGAARGLAFIHSSCKSLRLIHGNIKSTNILIDDDGNPKISDFGLLAFASPKSNGYRAPEAYVDTRKLTQKSDVYSFGVLLLELLTGKCPLSMDNSSNETGTLDLPRWVQSVVREEWTAEVFDLELMRYRDVEEEMVGMLQIAMSCTQNSPEERPKMNHVVKMIHELRGYDDSQSHGSAETASDSISLPEDACRASE